MRKIYANGLDVNLGRLGEDRMLVTTTLLHYSMKGMIWVCKYFSTSKMKHKYLCKVV